MCACTWWYDEWALWACRTRRRIRNITIIIPTHCYTPCWILPWQVTTENRVFALIWTIVWGIKNGTEILLSSGRTGYQVYGNLRPSIFLGVTWPRLVDVYGGFGPTYLSINRRLLDCLTTTDKTKNIFETSVTY